MKKQIWVATALTMLFGLDAGLGGVGPAMAATLPARAPGLWQSTTTVTGADGKPLANAANVVTVSCVDPATDIKFFVSGGSACSRLVIAGTGATYTIDGSCMQQGKPVRIHETLTYDSNQRVALIATLGAATGPVTVTSQLQWQGACPSGMAPGDEGDMANGVFSKADNIDDPVNQ
jgi:hypothetical protein